MKRHLFLSLAASCCLMGAEIYNLGVVEVSAKSDIHELSTNTVSQEVIKDTNSQTITQALITQPGVFMQQSAMRSEEKVRIRGFDNSRVAIFIDGIPIYVPYDKNIDYNRFNTYDISEINIQKGYVSPIFGANTMGGAINLITKKPIKEFEGSIGAGIFSGKGHEEFINLGTKLDWFYGILSLSNYNKDYFRTSKDWQGHSYWSDNDHKRPNSDQKDKKANIKLGITPNESDEYSFNYIIQRGEKGQPYYNGVHPGYYGNNANQARRTWRWPDWDKTSYYFLSKTAFFDEFTTLKTKLYRDEFYNQMYNYNGARNTTGAYTTSEYDDYTMGGAVELDFKFNEANILKLSAGLKDDNHKVIDSTSPNADVKNQSQTYSYGAEYSWGINENFTWVVGGSYDYNKIKKAQYRDANQTYIAGEFDKYDAKAFNPQTILYFTPFNGTNFYASVSQRTNMPTLKDRYSTRFGNYEPNPDLKAEKATNYEVGASHEIVKDTTAKIALFYTKTKDYIDTIRVGTLNKNVNMGEEKQKGVELSLDSKVLDNLSIYGSYAYIDAEILNTTEYLVAGLPEHSVFAYLKYSPIAMLDIIPQFRFESKRYDSSDPQDAQYANKKYVLADLKLAIRPISDLELSLKVNNIFDEDYSYNYGWPAEGRNYYAGFEYSF